MEDTKNILIALGRLEGKVESLISTQQHHNEELGRLDKRMRTLEQGKSALMGAAAAVGGLASFAVSWIFRNST